MSRLPFDVRISRSPELIARGIERASHALSAGDRATAEREYKAAMRAGLRHPASWSNLAALGVALGELDAARQHAHRALQLDAGHSDALVNFGAASWYLGQQRDAAQAMQQALVLAPGLEAASLNLAMMLRAVQKPDQAQAVLASALVHNPNSARLRRAMAEICRQQGDTDGARLHALVALSALLPTLAPAPGPDDGAEAESEEAQRKLLWAMTDTCDRLESAGIDYHLVGGVVLGIVRQGRPFAGDKDVDLGLPFDVDREQVAALFSTGYTRMQVPDPESARRWCLGFLHDATGVGIDLFFKQPVDGALRICLGWPDDLIFDLPQYAVGSFRWQGRDWPAPVPLEDYLDADYGVDWRSPTREFEGHVYNKRWHDSQVSSPSLAPGSIPRALNLGLLRLLGALGEQRWPKALALCDQLLARERMIEVERVRHSLLKAGIG